MTRIVVVSAPRSGTHMLCRMISRAAQIPWRVPVTTAGAVLIEAESWVVGVHEKWTDALAIDAQLVGLKRDRASHEASLARFGMSYESCAEIVESLPSQFTVTYEALVAGESSELAKLESLTGVTGIRPEPLAKRYAGPFEWCR